MSDRLNRIHPKVQAEPERVAHQLRRLANVLDMADDGYQVSFYTGNLSDEGVGPVAIAWAIVALMIADAADMDSVTLRAMATTIDKDVPHARLF